MGSKGSAQTTSNTTTAPDSNAYQAYLSLLNRANTVGSTAYTPYTGDLTAGINDQQTQGISGINAAANYASPFVSSAANDINQAGQPLSAADIQKYQDPYTQQVVNATQAQFADQNQQQLQQVRGNAASLGALGGDREAIAEAETTKQQNLAQNPVIAGLYSQGYNNAVNTAAGQQQVGLQAGAGLGNLGIAGQNAALTGANAQVGAGTLQQQTQQAQLNALYAQYQQQQAFPYQQIGWEAGIDTGVGSQLGGTSNGVTTGPAPNSTNAILGGGLALAGLAAAPFTGGASLAATTAGVKAMSARGGRIPYAGGGQVMSSPYGDASFIPQIQITHGQGAPRANAPSLPQQQATKVPDVSGLGSIFKSNGSQPTNIVPGALSNTVPADLSGYSNPGSLGGLYARGGGINVPRFANGGAPDVSDSSSPNWYVTRGFQDITGLDPGEDHPDNSDLAAGIGTRFQNPVMGVNVPTPMARPAGLGAVAPAVAPTDETAAPYPPARVPARIDDQGSTQDDALAYDTPRGAASRNALSGIGGNPPAIPLAAPTDGSGRDTGGFGGLLSGLVSGIGNANLSQYSVPLISAGLSMMASRSPYLAEAIGEGGLQGLQTYGAQKKTEHDQALEQRKLDTELARMKEAADHAQAQLKETSRHNLATENKLPENYEMDPDGNGYHFIKGSPADPAVIQSQASAKRLPGMSDEALGTMADAYMVGNTAVIAQLSRGTAGPDNLNRFWNTVEQRLKEQGLSGRDLAAAKANFGAQSAAAITAARREANVSASVEEAKLTFPLALEASQAVPRTEFVPWNELVQKVQKGTSSPALAKFYTATQGVITAYAQAMARTGVATVDGRHAAEALLRTADGPEAYAAVIGQMTREMKAAETAPEIVRKNVLSRISGRPATETTAAPAAPAPAAASGAAAIPPPDQREVGKVYVTPRGPATWNGGGWHLVAQ